MLPTTRKLARAFAVANAAVGLAGFAGPAVRGNDDRFINLHAGRLFGLPAINPAHAAMHLALGAAGMRMLDDDASGRRYVALQAAAFTPLAGAGLAVVRGKPGIHYMMGLAVDRMANAIHVAWATAAAAAVVRDRATS